MKKMALYDVEAVGQYLNKIPFKAVALVPSEVDGKLKSIPTSSVLIKGQSFNSRREEIRELAPGCDMYYALETESDLTPEMRESLKLSKTTVSVDDNDLVTILDKRMVDLNVDLLSKEEAKELRKMGINHSRLSNSDIEKLEKSEMKYLLSSDYIQATHLTTAGREIVSLDEIRNVDNTLEYQEDEIKTHPFEGEAEKIFTFYEYDLFTDSLPPFGGEPYEFEQVARSTDGKPVWKATPDILRRRNNEEHATMVYEKGNRTLVKVPDGKEGEKIRKALELYDPESIREFKEYNHMGKNYLVEVTLKLNLEPKDTSKVL